MKENGRHRVQMPEVAESVSGLTHDVIELAELQAQLLTSELKKSSQKTRTCLILAIVGFCLLLASIPVALFALAEVLVEQLDWSQIIWIWSGRSSRPIGKRGLFWLGLRHCSKRANFAPAISPGIQSEYRLD